MLIWKLCLIDQKLMLDLKIKWCCRLQHYHTEKQVHITSLISVELRFPLLKNFERAEIEQICEILLESEMMRLYRRFVFYSSQTES